MERCCLPSAMAAAGAPGRGNRAGTRQRGFRLVQSTRESSARLGRRSSGCFLVATQPPSADRPRHQATGSLPGNWPTAAGARCFLKAAAAAATSCCPSLPSPTTAQRLTWCLLYCCTKADRYKREKGRVRAAQRLCGPSLVWLTPGTATLPTAALLSAPASAAGIAGRQGEQQSWCRRQSALPSCKVAGRADPKHTWVSKLTPLIGCSSHQIVGQTYAVLAMHTQ
jgi:hypothetical protein